MWCPVFLWFFKEHNWIFAEYSGNFFMLCLQGNSEM